jgi:AcrR family transcriptional regulator
MIVGRPYVMAARREAVGEMRRRILEAAIDLLGERLRSDIRLEDVARRSGAGIQTVLRHFGTRAALLEEAISGVQAAHARTRPVTSGGVEPAVRTLFDQYEALGDIVVRNLADEAADPTVGEMLEIGRRFHRDWVTAQFLAEPSPRASSEVVDALVVATDVYVWKVLRRDLRLERDSAQAVVRRLIEGVLKTAAEEGR